MSLERKRKEMDILNQKSFYTRKYKLKDPFGNPYKLLAKFYVTRDNLLDVKFYLGGMNGGIPHSLSNMQSKSNLKPDFECTTIVEERHLDAMIEDPEMWLGGILTELYECELDMENVGDLEGLFDFDNQVARWVNSGVKECQGVF